MGSSRCRTCLSRTRWARPVAGRACPGLWAWPHLPEDFSTSAQDVRHVSVYWEAQTGRHVHRLHRIVRHWTVWGRGPSLWPTCEHKRLPECLPTGSARRIGHIFILTHLRREYCCSAEISSGATDFRGFRRQWRLCHAAEGRSVTVAAAGRLTTGGCRRYDTQLRFRSSSGRLELGSDEGSQVPL